MKVLQLLCLKMTPDRWAQWIEGHKKWARKTGALVAWSRRYGINLQVLARAWLLFVERAVMYGGSVVRLAPSGLACLDSTQRRVGRMLMGFSRQSPTPAVLGELGWLPWSCALMGERIGLCQRLVYSPSQYTQWVVRASTKLEGSWLERCVHSCAVWSGDRWPHQGMSQHWK